MGDARQFPEAQMQVSPVKQHPAQAAGGASQVALRTKDGTMMIPLMGVGCWSWGDDKGVWGWGDYDRSLTKKSISAAFETSLNSNIYLFDTAETYGSGLSEQIVGDLTRNSKKGILIATKFQPGKWANTRVRRAMMQAAKESCKRLGVTKIDLYQIHAPLHRDSLHEQGLGLADVVDAGLARAVGVSNFNLQEVQQVHAALASRGIPLATNQVEYSLLRQLPDTGLKAGCEALGVKLLAYSPLAMGRLTGKYSAGHEPKGNRGFGAVPMAQLEPLLSKLREVAARHSCTPAQVALAWVIAKVPKSSERPREKSSEHPPQIIRTPSRKRPGAAQK
jgi:aryl-alcohol dehydrogenase-like predicted oxidoreductase